MFLSITYFKTGIAGRQPHLAAVFPPYPKKTIKRLTSATLSFREFIKRDEIGPLINVKGTVLATAAMPLPSVVNTTPQMAVAVIAVESIQ